MCIRDRAIDVPSIYKIPLQLYEQRFDSLVMGKLGLEPKQEPDLEDWRALSLIHI